MEQVELKAEIRKEIGKQSVKRLRSAGILPGVMYKAGEKTLNLKLQRRDFLKALRTERGENVLINLKLSRDDKPLTNTVIIKEIQYHPTRGDILHVDFNQISLTETLTVNVPIELRGEALGVKEGGVLNHVLREIEIECLPTQIPEKIEFDVTSLAIGDAVRARDLTVPKEIKVLTEPDATVASLEPPAVEKVEEKPEEEITEPEVITERKPAAESPEE